MASCVTIILLVSLASSQASDNLVVACTSCVSQETVTQSMLQAGKTNLGTSSVIRDSDVEGTNQKPSVFVLHRKDKTSAVDGVLFMQDGTIFAENALEIFCSKMDACLTDLPLAVAQASVEHITAVQKQLPKLAFAELTDHLPQVVRYLKSHISIEELPSVLEKYRKAGVSLPVGTIVQEFKEEHESLKESMLQVENKISVDVKEEIGENAKKDTSHMLPRSVQHQKDKAHAHLVAMMSLL